MTTENLILPREDYLRLRELKGNTLLSEELDKATVVAPDRIPKDLVTMNSRFVYVDEKLGSEREVELVYPEEADAAAGKISVLAPVGCALLGMVAGCPVDWEFPGGEIRRLRVERIVSQPDFTLSPLSVA